MKIAIIGATGFVGTQVVKELEGRGHQLTAIARSAKNSTTTTEYKQVDINQADELVKALRDHDTVISAFNAGWTNPNLYEDFLSGSKLIQNAVKQAGVKRLIIVGGAGSLFVAPEVQAVDTPDFPKEFHAGASAARDYLTILREEQELDWVFFSPALEMHPGITTGRTGHYRLGLENPVFNSDGRSTLSVEDTAVVIADEAERPRHHRARFTAAY